MAPPSSPSGVVLDRHGIGGGGSYRGVCGSVVPLSNASTFPSPHLQSGDSAISKEVPLVEDTGKIPLSDEKCLPPQHPRNSRQIWSCRQNLDSCIKSQDSFQEETEECNIPSEALARCKSLHAPSVSRSSSSSSVLSCSPFSPMQESNGFASAIRRHTNESPDSPNFDQALRNVMESHIATARCRREQAQVNSVHPVASRDHISNMPIASTVGVPYPALRVERPFLFDENSHPLHEILARAMGVPNLHEIHKHPSQDMSTLMKPLLDQNVRRSFHECYDNFVTTFCIPLLHSVAMAKNVFHIKSRGSNSAAITYRYQAFPSIHIVRPGEFSTGPHCDTAYGYSIGNLNFHIPLTPTYGTNSLYTESHPGREDWHPLTAKAIGLGYVFDGARCIHFTMENMTEHTRVSLDFRIAICRSDEIPGNEDTIDDGLCSKDILKDEFSSAGPGYYEEALINTTSRSFGSRHLGPVVAKKSGSGNRLMNPDKRVGFPFV